MHGKKTKNRQRWKWSNYPSYLFCTYQARYQSWKAAVQDWLDLLLWLNDKRVFAITLPKNQDETPHTFAPSPSWSQGFVPHTTPGCYFIRGQTVYCFREVRATRVRSGSLPDCAHPKWEPTRCGHAQATPLNARPPPPNFISRETSFHFKPARVSLRSHPAPAEMQPGQPGFDRCD